MKVFCGRTDCRFSMNEECRTSAISVDGSGCTTYEPGITQDTGIEETTFWGHLLAHPESGEWDDQ